MSTLADIRVEVIANVKDDSGKLVNPTDYDNAINAALMAYSRLKPFEVPEDIAGVGTSQVLLPSTWSPEFSQIVSVEYPIGDFPPTLLETEDFIVTDRAGILTLSFDLAVTESVRITYTTLRSADDIADIDVHAFCALAASYALETLANAYAQTGDSTIAADVVNYRSKSSEFSARAKQYMKLYKDHMGLKDNDTTAPACSVVDSGVNYPGGADRLTHPRWARRKR